MTTKTTINPTECRLLSLLVPFREDGASPTFLAVHSGIARDTVYVQLGRLRLKRMVSPLRVGANGSAVRYRITTTGRKARERFAAAVGLTT
jgi:DNA-binding MarR family transcriptional regulator